MSSSRAQAGLSLIELVVFIVVMGIALVTMMLFYNQFTRASLDSLIHKQALAIASSLMEEIQLQPFTYCDPDDPAVHAASSSADCDPALIENMGPEAGETRYGVPRFDNVNDYAGFPAMLPGTIRTISEPTPIAPLAGYGVAVNVVAADNEVGAVAGGNALRIIVTATHAKTGTTVTLQGYRLRYAPNSP